MLYVVINAWAYPWPNLPWIWSCRTNRASLLSGNICQAGSTSSVSEAPAWWHSTFITEIFSLWLDGNVLACRCQPCSANWPLIPPYLKARQAGSCNTEVISIITPNHIAFECTAKSIRLWDSAADATDGDHAGGWLSLRGDRCLKCRCWQSCNHNKTRGKRGFVKTPGDTHKAHNYCVSWNI